jgi:HAMP domain-containing protein
MFKSKYGLISAVLVILVTIISFVVIRGKIVKNANQAALNKLNKGDGILRNLEVLNKGNSIKLASQGAKLVRKKFDEYNKTLNKLNKIMYREIRRIERDGETPVLVAILGNKHGAGKAENIRWLAVNNNVVTENYLNEWLTPGLVDNLIKATKFKNVIKKHEKPVAGRPVAGKKVDKKAVKKVDEKVDKKVDKKTAKKTDKKADEKTAKKTGKKSAKAGYDPKPEKNAINVPLIFKGEKLSKLYVNPSIPSQYKISGIKHVFQVSIVDKLMQGANGKIIPVYEGSLILGFKDYDSHFTKLKAVKLILRLARNKKLRKTVAKVQAAKTELFSILNKMRKKGEMDVEGRKPYAIMLVNKNGTVVTRDKDDTKASGFNYINIKSRKMHLIGKVLKSKSVSYDIMKKSTIDRSRKIKTSTGLYHGAAVPIWGEGQIAGALAVFWSFDIRLSQIEKMADINVAFFYNKDIYFPNFKSTTKNNQLNETFKGRIDNIVSSPLIKNKKAKIKGEVFKFGGEKFQGAIFSYNKTNLKGLKYGYAIFVNETKIMKRSKGTCPMIIGFGIFALLLVIILEFLIFGYLLDGIDLIEEGVHEVAAGDMDFIFGRVSNETEGLSNSLNEMLNVVFGREEFDENGEPPIKEGIQLISLGSLPEMPFIETNEEVSELENLGEKEYYEEVYNRFKKCWEELGEEDPVPSIDLFKQRVNLYERMFVRKMTCDHVLFDVKTNDDGITLVPLPVS